MSAMGMMDSVMTFLQALQGLPAYALVYAVLAGSGFGLPMNEELLLIAAAALTLRGVMDPLALIAVAWVGVLTADGLIFHWGRRFGPSLLRHRFLARSMPEKRLAAVQEAMARYGPACIFFVRFMPGLRSPLYFAAGSLKMPYRHLFVFDGAAAMIELPLLVYGVRYLGGRWEQIVDTVQQFQSVLVPAAVLVLLGVWLYRRARRS